MTYFCSSRVVGEKEQKKHVGPPYTFSIIFASSQFLHFTLFTLKHIYTSVGNEWRMDIPYLPQCGNDKNKNGCEKSNNFAPEHWYYAVVSFVNVPVLYV